MPKGIHGTCTRAIATPVCVYLKCPQVIQDPLLNAGLWPFSGNQFHRAPIQLGR
jgi:hypothetical protein